MKSHLMRTSLFIQSEMGAMSWLQLFPRTNRWVRWRYGTYFLPRLAILWDRPSKSHIWAFFWVSCDCLKRRSIEDIPPSRWICFSPGLRGCMAVKTQMCSTGDDASSHPKCVLRAASPSNPWKKHIHVLVRLPPTNSTSMCGMTVKRAYHCCDNDWLLLARNSALQMQRRRALMG